MVVYPAKHFFEARFPKLEDHEEEIFFQHPTHKIKCNQLGVLYFEEEDFAIYETHGISVVRQRKIVKNCGSKTKVIWECYEGEVIANPHFFYINGNVLDTRRENLRKSSNLSPKEREECLKVKRKFVKNSVEHLIKIENRVKELNISKKELYELLYLPSWLMAARKKIKSA